MNEPLDLNVGDYVDVDVSTKPNDSYFSSGSKHLRIVKIDNNHLCVKTADNKDSWWIERDMARMSCQSTEAEPNEIEPAESEPIDYDAVWNNPKKNVKNKKEINEYSLVMIDGYKPLQRVVKVTPKTCTVLIDGKQKRFLKTDCYPMFEQKDTGVIRVGNVVVYGNNALGVVTKVGKNGLLVLHTNIRIQQGNVKKLYTAFRNETLFYDVYSCGTIAMKGKEYKTKEELFNEYLTYSFSAVDVSSDYEHEKIRSHYNLDENSVVPKETKLYEVLSTTLEHPLNVQVKRWPLLVGPSGSGKTSLAVAYCDNNNREYVKLQGTAQLSVDDLIGYFSLTEVNNYKRSLLRDAVEFGKVFILDEIDACNPNTLLVLNGLKQDKFQFPDELIDVHPEFKLIATANTLEYSEEYNARAPMDKATQSRFKVIHYDMEPHELAIRYGFKYIKDIPNIERLTPRDVEGIVIDKKIEEENND